MLNAIQHWQAQVPYVATVLAMICLASLTFTFLLHSSAGLKISRDSLVKIGKPVEKQLQRKIPKIIHQTWKNHELPLEFQKWSRSWRECLPDWEYKLHTDEDNRNFIAKHFPEFLQTYDSYDPPIKRVDAARYAYLAIEGGLYADLDMECVRDPTQLTDLSINSEVDLTLACEKFSKGGQISNAIMLSSSDEGRAFFKKLMQRLPNSSSLETCDATGPQFLTRSFVDYLMDGVSVDNPDERTRLSDFRPEFGTVKSLRKGTALIAVADDALLFNIPWFGLDIKEYCMDREWCTRRFPYAMSVSHWSSSWLPEINTLSTGDFIRAYDFENKKCAFRGEDRLFKLTKSPEEDMDLLEHCSQTCKANPSCRFFSMLPDHSCIGCKGQPSEAYEGFWTYQMTNKDAPTAEMIDKPTMASDMSATSSQVKLPRLPSLDNSRMFGLDNLECSTEDDDRLFEIHGFPENVDQVDYCSQECKARLNCKFFNIVQGNFCIGCKREPTGPRNSSWTYKMTAEDRNPFLATSFSRMFALDNKKCSAERGDRLFKLDNMSADTDQIYACNKACRDSPGCSFFGVHLYSQWCIGCKEEPVEESVGFWTYKMTLSEKVASKTPHETLAHGTGEVAPLIQSGESLNLESSSICSCLVDGLMGTPLAKCNKVLKQQMDHLHESGDSRRETFRRLLDSHLHRC